MASCNKCRKKVRSHDMWTDQYCKYCWADAGKAIYAWDVPRASRREKSSENFKWSERSELNTYVKG